MSFDLIILAISVITISVLGLVVYVRNEQSRISQSFLAISLATVAWSVSNYFADHADPIQLSDFFARLAFAAGIWIVFSLLIFSYVFPKNRLSSRRLTVMVASLVLLTLFSMSNLVLVGVSKTSGAVGIEIKIGQLYGLYLVSIVACIILIISSLYRSYRSSNALRQSQIRLIAGGIILSALYAVATNLIFPLLVSDWTSSRFGTLASVIFVSAIAYAIVRYRFLDIRLLVTRSVAYLLVLGTLGVAYSLIVFGVSSLFFGQQGVPADRQLVYLVLALLLGLTFQPLKHFFDKLTQALFYREAYEPQRVLDAVSAVLVSTNSVQKLVEGVAMATDQALRPRFAQVVLVQDKQLRTLMFGKKSEVLDSKTIWATIALKQPLLVLDELDNHTQEFYRELRQADVSIVVRLHTAKEFIGLVFLGSKETGGIYTAQDLNVIRIVADELSVAVQNALRFERIERFNETLQQEVDDATAELRKTNKKLKALDEAKDEFISMASHQLRTPLTSVKGYLSMALEGDAGPLKSDQHHLVQEAYSSAQRMVYMIADLLNVSRIQTGKFVLEPSAVSLPTLIHEEIEQLDATAKGRGLTLELDIPSQFPTIRVDENKIRQVIMNFIDNAIFYSKSGGTIKISLSKTDTTVVFTVRDDGIGVPAKEQAHLFTKFFRATNARQARPDGTGIGLFMARKVIDAHEGRIIFKSEENKGSTFGFSLPLKGIPG